MRFTEFKLSKKIHWEKTRNKGAAELYCCKAETRTGDIFSKGYPKPVEYIKPEQFYEWQKALYTILKDKPHPRKIYWIYEETGNTGKSGFVKSLVCMK